MWIIKVSTISLLCAIVSVQSVPHHNNPEEHGDAAHSHSHSHGEVTHSHPHPKGDVEHSHEHTHGDVTQTHTQDQTHPHTEEQLQEQPHSHTHSHVHSHEHSHGEIVHSHPHSHKHAHMHAHVDPGHSHDGDQKADHAHQGMEVNSKNHHPVSAHGETSTNQAKMGMNCRKRDSKEPKYEVVFTRNVGSVHYEIRRYGKRFAIETQMGTPSSESEGRRSAFWRLAGYIGVMGEPQNEGASKIAMTAPVAMKPSEKVKGQSIPMTAPVATGNDATSGERVMQFFLPSAMDDMSKIPKPTHSDVTVKEIPPAVGAVVRYNGNFIEENNMAHAKEFAKQLKDDGLDIDEKAFMEKHQVWGFDPPRTDPMCRRNEIWIELTDEQVEKLRSSPSNGDVTHSHPHAHDDTEHEHEHTHGDVTHTHNHAHQNSQDQTHPHSQEQLQEHPHSHPHSHVHSHEHSHGDIVHSHPHSHTHAHTHAHSNPVHSHDGDQNVDHAHQGTDVNQQNHHAQADHEKVAHSHEHTNQLSHQHSHPHTQEQLKEQPHSHTHPHVHSHEHSHGDIVHAHPHSHTHTHTHAHLKPGHGHDGDQKADHAHQGLEDDPQNHHAESDHEKVPHSHKNTNQLSHEHLHLHSQDQLQPQPHSPATPTAVPAIADAASKTSMQTVQSSNNFDETVAKLKQFMEEKGLTTFAEIDHAKGAEEAGLILAPATVLIFGNPKAGTLLMQDDINIAVDLPLKVLVFVKDDKVMVGYRVPSLTMNHYNLSSHRGILTKMDGLFKKMTGVVRSNEGSAMN